MPMQGYIGYEFDEDQRAEIQAGVEACVDVNLYAQPEFLAIQMRQIRLGLQEDLDVTAYASPQFDWFQMEEIRLGLKEKLNYKIYAKPSIDYKRMRQLRIGLQRGMDLSPYVQLNAGVLRELRRALTSKVSIVEYIREGYDVEQLEQIRAALEMKLDIKPHICKEHIGPSIREIRLGLEKNLPVSIYANMEYSWQQMREIRLGLESDVDIEEYKNSLYSWQQMREIRLGLEAGINIAAYKSFVHTGYEMSRIRNQIMTDAMNGILNGMSKELVDEYVKVYISNDEMEACVEVNLEHDVTLTPRDLEDKLRAHGVCEGLLKDEIAEIARKKKYHKTIVIARGQRPQRGEDGYYEFFFNTEPSREPRILEDGTADFREIKWYEIVKEGQKIACYHPAGYGKSGFTVTGKFLKAKRGMEKSVLSGKNFELLPDRVTYVASITGKIDMIEETRVEINKVLVLDEVNLATGNVNFEGSVFVTGNVSKGAVICATENVVIAGYVEGATIRCGEDVCLRQGMNGAGVGLIEAKGSVIGQFFEKTLIIAGGDVSAHYCLNCDIRAEGVVTIYGKKGMIVGGFTRGGKGIVAYTVGNNARIATQLNAGIDNVFLNEMKQMDVKIEGVQRELAILSNAYRDFQAKYAAEVRNTMELYLKIEDAIYTKEKQLAELQQQKEIQEETMKEMLGAKVVVDGVLHEGTEIVIDNIRWKSQSISSVVIRCHNWRIVVEAN